MVHNILIAVDETPSARAAVDWTRQLQSEQRQNGNDVSATMLNVIHGNVYEGVECFGATYNHEELAALRLFDDLLDSDADAIETEIRAGGAAQVILAEAEAQQADLIVVGTRHEGAVRQALMGSVSQALAAARERPVAVIPAESEIGTKLTTVGYDGSPGSRAALRWALSNSVGDVRVICAAESEREAVDAHERLEALLPALGHDAEGRVQSTVVVGDAVEALSGSDAPQVVVGARNDDPLNDTIWGSTTTRLIAETLHPVVVVPPGMWD